MTPSTKGTIKFVMLQQDQCNIEIDVGENDPIYENAILTLKMSNLPEMNFGFIMWGYSEKDNTTCAFGNNDPNLTTQWWSYWGANIGNTLQFELTSSINGNVPPLPTVDTNLWSTTAADEGGFYGTFDITIPAGVNVIYVGGGINGSLVGEPCYCSMWSSTKTWFSANNENSAFGNAFVGVTPLKKYRVTVDYGSEIDGIGGSAFIRYSQRINGITPNVLDY